MSFWRTVKRGFGYGFGGRLGWEAGGLVWGWIMKIALIIGAGVGLPMIGESVGTYNQVKQRLEQQAQQQPAKAEKKQEVGHGAR